MTLKLLPLTIIIAKNAAQIIILDIAINGGSQQQEYLSSHSWKMTPFLKYIGASIATSHCPG